VFSAVSVVVAIVSSVLETGAEGSATDVSAMAVGVKIQISESGAGYCFQIDGSSMTVIAEL